MGRPCEQEQGSESMRNRRLFVSTTDKIPLKTFWEAVERRLAACSAKELRAILLGMAQETSPDQSEETS